MRGYALLEIGDVAVHGDAPQLQGVLHAEAMSETGSKLTSKVCNAGLGGDNLPLAVPP